MSLLEQLPQSTNEVEQYQKNVEYSQHDLDEEFGAAFLIESSQGDTEPMWLSGFASDELPSFVLHGNSHDGDHAYEVVGGSLQGSDDEGYYLRSKVVSAEQLSPVAQDLMRRRLEMTPDEQRAIVPDNPEALRLALEELQHRRVRKAGSVTLRLLGVE